MKRLLSTSLCALLLAAPLFAQELQVGIAKWKGDKRAAVSLTFDDGLAEHYTIVAPELEKRGFRGTFGVCGALINADADHISRTDRMTWPQLREMAQRGHEISNHGWQHRNHGRFPLDTIRYDIQHNDSMILLHTGVKPTTFFYPNNTKRPEPMRLAEQGRVGTRTFQISMGSKRWQPWMEQWVEALVDSCGGMVTMTHGITYGYDAFKDAKRLTGFLDLLKRREGQLWVCLLNDFLAYTKERNETKLSVERKGKRLFVTPHTPLDTAIYHYPLTMRVVVNNSKKTVTATQDGRALTVRMKNDSVAVFDFNPNGGTIELASVKRKTQPATVIITAGQSNTDGRVMNTELPKYIAKQPYKYCHWCYGSGGKYITGKGSFQLFSPRIGGDKRNERWAYDAVVYRRLEKELKRDFYVVKWSLGGTAIDTTCTSTSRKYWSADKAWLARNKSTAEGGHSLLKSFTEEIDACIDNKLNALPEGFTVRAMLWHQGESDHKAGDRYYDNLKAVVQYVRLHLAQKTGDDRYLHLPFVCGTVSRLNKCYNEKVEQALLRLQSEDPDFHVVDMSDAELQKDRLHFTAKSAERLGNAMYELIKE